MIELCPLKTMLALAATLIASAALAQTPLAAMTTPDSTTTQAVPSEQGPITSSIDPLIQKRIDDKARRTEYKMEKTRAKSDYKNEMPSPWPLHWMPWLH